MSLRRVAVGLALVAMGVVAGCSGGGGLGGGSTASEGVAPAADEAGGSAQRATGEAGDSAQRATGEAGGSGQGAAPAGRAGADAQVRLVDLGNRIVRTATVDLEVGKGRLSDTINRATDVVTRARGTYVGSSTSVPDGDPASGQVTFRVPVDAFEAVLRDLKALGTYRGEESGTEDVTNQYIDLNGQLAAWRAQERVYLRLLNRARSIADVIAVQNQLQQVQSNIERLQGQVDHLEDQSSFSTIVLRISEPGVAGPAGKPGRFARAWATAVNGLAVMAAAVLVAVVWLVPVVVLAGLALLGFRAFRRPRPA